ncbi:hypothetical protein SUDANB126_04031 [Streptomyces sp. enrichment culture]
MTPPRRRTPSLESLPVIVEPPPRRGPQPCDTGNPACGAPARLYPAGWRCDRHRPTTYRPE